MTRCAIPELLRPKQNRHCFRLLLQQRVAPDTRYCGVLARQRKLGLRMIERRSRRPCRCGMTALALCPHRLRMAIFMTADAACAQSEKRLPTRLLHKRLHVLVLNQPRCMALLAADCCVLSRSHEARARMIKREPINQNRLRLSAKVFLMTCNARL